MFPKLPDGLATIRGFGNQSHIRLSADQYSNALANNRVIINYQNAN